MDIDIYRVTHLGFLLLYNDLLTYLLQRFQICAHMPSALHVFSQIKQVYNSKNLKV